MALRFVGMPADADSNGPRPGRPSSGGVAGPGVWWATARPVDPALVDPATRDRVAAMRREGDRHRHLTAVLLGDALVRLHGGDNARVVRERGRAPRVVGSDTPLHMSVSHTGHIVAVALGPGPVGVDVESDDARIDGVAGALAEGEKAAIAFLPDPRRAVALRRAWVRKEAVLKALGTGFARDPRTIELSSPGDPPAVVAPPDLAAPGAMTIWDLDGPPGSVAALALMGQADQVRKEDGDALLDVIGA